PQDPTWIGAWWIGFLFIGFMQIGPSITLFFFPESSSKKKKCQQKSLEANGGGGTANGHNLKIGGMPTTTVVPSRKERTKLTLYDRHVRAESCTTEPGLFAFLRSYSAVLSSKVYVGASIARVLDIFAFKGYFVFLPKFLENHYGIPQYRVHLFIAAFGVLGFALGTASGGLIMRWNNLNK
uniref:SO1C1 n=1 Tax=Globodera pallida TaxID=36090 RepID=A0A183CTU8_GLOPA